MTRKHFQAIADVIMAQRQSYGTNWDSNLFRALDDTSAQLADMLRGQNANFDRERFLTACGYGTKGE